MNDFWDFLLLAIMWCLIIFLVTMIPVACYYNAKQEEELRECFMQEIKTKECEYKLYRYEHKRNNHTTVMPMPIVVR